MHTKLARSYSITVERERQFITEKIFPATVSLPDGDAVALKAQKLQYYQISETPTNSTVWDWLTRCSFSTKIEPRGFSLTPTNLHQTTCIARNKQHDI